MQSPFADPHVQCNYNTTLKFAEPRLQFCHVDCCKCSTNISPAHFPALFGACDAVRGNRYAEIRTRSHTQALLTVMSCCRCNRSGRCANCSCVKGGRPCQGCLPQRLGNCLNTLYSQPTHPTQTEHQVTTSGSTLRSDIDEAAVEQPATPSTADHPAYIDPPEHDTDTSSASSSIVDRPAIASLLPPPPVMQPPNYSWGICTGSVFCTKVDAAYDEVVL